MKKTFTFFSIFLIFSLLSCDNKNENKKSSTIKQKQTPKEILIIDSDYTFNEAIEGSKAPKEILNQLQLISVKYYSTDGKIHQGQILTNKKIAQDLKKMFEYFLTQRFVIKQVIPIVRFKWDDDLSMQANNTYSFCYRNVSYSKHARGMAIDINPFFNPVRWKKGYEHRINKPIGAVYNPKVPGTFYETHPAILMIKEIGFRWGHGFKRNFDDHHFEKQ